MLSSRMRRVHQSPTYFRNAHPEAEQRSPTPSLTTTSTLRPEGPQHTSPGRRARLSVPGVPGQNRRAQSGSPANLFAGVKSASALPKVVVEAKPQRLNCLPQPRHKGDGETYAGELLTVHPRAALRVTAHESTLWSERSRPAQSRTESVSHRQGLSQSDVRPPSRRA